MAAVNEKPWAVLRILQWTTAYFKEKEIHSPRLTAEILLAHSLNQTRMYLYTHHDQPLHVDERERFKALVRQRIQGTPTQYLTGKQEFWSLEFQVTPDVLIPRPETEHLVEAAVKLAARFAQPLIVDIGTGSGIIAISLKHELPQAHVFASDLSEAALTVAQSNATTLLHDDSQITFAQGDLFAPFVGIHFDLIVSNPPYISTAEYAAISHEVRDFEPQAALLAGEQGLDVYQRLIPAAGAHLSPGGYVLVEIGYGQKDAVIAVFQQHGLTIQNVIQDYARIDRVLIAQIGN